MVAFAASWRRSTLRSRLWWICSKRRTCSTNWLPSSRYRLWRLLLHEGVHDVRVDFLYAYHGTGERPRNARMNQQRFGQGTPSLQSTLSVLYQTVPADLVGPVGYLTILHLKRDARLPRSYILTRCKKSKLEFERRAAPRRFIVRQLATTLQPYGSQISEVGGCALVH